MGLQALWDGRSWPTAAVAASRFEAADFTLPDQSSERRDCAQSCLIARVVGEVLTGDDMPCRIYIVTEYTKIAS